MPKVLFVNKYFYNRGGAEKVFFDEASLLKENGHKVGFFSIDHPRNFPSPYEAYFLPGVDYEENLTLTQRLREASRICYSWQARKRLRSLLAKEQFGIVHLHNIYHQISPSILDELIYFGIPAVMTLHDYKMVCPTYNLLHRTEICERCAQGHYFHCLLCRCTKGSYAKSLVNTLEMYLHHRIMKQYSKVTIFISPSRFLKSKLHQMGFAGEIVYLPNFIRVEKFQPAWGEAGNNIVYFGRLSREKGLDTLIDAVQGLKVSLRIVGEGPQRPELEEKVAKAGMDNVQFLGYLQGEELHNEIRKARFAVIPSKWYENNPIAVLEAFALGKPVVGSRLGGIPELVRDHQTGLTFEAGNVEDLREKICYLLNDQSLVIEMGKQARQVIEDEFNPNRHYSGLLEIYRSTVRLNKPL